MNQSYILSCEHAGNQVPERYQHLFKGEEDILYTHKAIDFGALRLAKHLQKKAEVPLYYTRISRLLSESDDLFFMWCFNNQRTVYEKNV